MVILGDPPIITTTSEGRTRDLGSTEAQGRWNGDGRILVRRSMDQACELDPSPLAPWTLDRHGSWTLMGGAPDGGFRRQQKLRGVSSADDPLGSRSHIADLGSRIPDDARAARSGSRI